MIHKLIGLLLFAVIVLFSSPIHGFEISGVDIDSEQEDKFYRYSSIPILRNLIRVTVDDGHAEDIDNLEGVTERFVFYVTVGIKGTTYNLPLSIEKWQVNLDTLEENYLLTITLFYSPEGKLTRQRICDAEGNFWVVEYNDEGKPVGVVDQGGNAAVFLPAQALLSIKSEEASFWTGIPYFLYDYIVYLVTTLNDAVNSIQNQLMTYSGIKPEFEQIGHDLIGKTLFFLAGYHTEEIAQGVIGSGEINNKVRITHINGILNSKEHTMSSAQLISRTHGGANVHYTYRPTQGVTLDLIKCFLVKMGYTSIEAYQLADYWKKLIKEMDDEGVILHYAHSIGAAETAGAKELLTPEEQQRIRVYTFGSPSLLPNAGFRSVVNYVSRRDGVSFFDPIGYIQGLISSSTNVVFIGDFNGIPLVDHTLHGASYRSIVETLGKEFVELYGEVGNPK